MFFHYYYDYMKPGKVDTPLYSACVFKSLNETRVLRNKSHLTLSCGLKTHAKTPPPTSSCTAPPPPPHPAALSVRSSVELRDLHLCRSSYAQFLSDRSRVQPSRIRPRLRAASPPAGVVVAVVGGERGAGGWLLPPSSRLFKMKRHGCGCDSSNIRGSAGDSWKP